MQRSQTSTLTEQHLLSSDLSPSPGAQCADRKLSDNAHQSTAPTSTAAGREPSPERSEYRLFPGHSAQRAPMAATARTGDSTLTDIGASRSRARYARRSMSVDTAMLEKMLPTPSNMQRPPPQQQQYGPGRADLKLSPASLPLPDTADPYRARRPEEQRSDTFENPLPLHSSPDAIAETEPPLSRVQQVQRLLVRQRALDHENSSSSSSSRHDTSSATRPAYRNAVTVSPPDSHYYRQHQVDKLMAAGLQAPGALASPQPQRRIGPGMQNMQRPSSPLRRQDSPASMSSGSTRDPVGLGLSFASNATTPDLAMFPAPGGRQHNAHSSRPPPPRDYGPPRTHSSNGFRPSPRPQSPHGSSMLTPSSPHRQYGIGQGSPQIGQRGPPAGSSPLADARSQPGFYTPPGMSSRRNFDPNLRVDTEISSAQQAQQAARQHQQRQQQQRQQYPPQHPQQYQQRPRENPQQRQQQYRPDPAQSRDNTTRPGTSQSQARPDTSHSQASVATHRTQPQEQPKSGIRKSRLEKALPAPPPIESLVPAAPPAEVPSREASPIRHSTSPPPAHLFTPKEATHPDRSPPKESSSRTASPERSSTPPRQASISAPSPISPVSPLSPFLIPEHLRSYIVYDSTTTTIEPAIGSPVSAMTTLSFDTAPPVPADAPSVPPLPRALARKPVGNTPPVQQTAPLSPPASKYQVKNTPRDESVSSPPQDRNLASLKPSPQPSEHSPSTNRTPEIPESPMHVEQAKTIAIQPLEKPVVEPGVHSHRKAPSESLNPSIITLADHSVDRDSQGRSQMLSVNGQPSPQFPDNASARSAGSKAASIMSVPSLFTMGDRPDSELRSPAFKGQPRPDSDAMGATPPMLMSEQPKLADLQNELKQEDAAMEAGLPYATNDHSHRSYGSAAPSPRGRRPTLEDSLKSASPARANFDVDPRQSVQTRRAVGDGKTSFESKGRPSTDSQSTTAVPPRVDSAVASRSRGTTLDSKASFERRGRPSEDSLVTALPQIPSRSPARDAALQKQSSFERRPRPNDDSAVTALPQLRSRTQDQQTSLSKKPSKELNPRLVMPSQTTGSDSEDDLPPARNPARTPTREQMNARGLPQSKSDPALVPAPISTQPARVPMPARSKTMPLELPPATQNIVLNSDSPTKLPSYKSFFMQQETPSDEPPQPEVIVPRPIIPEVPTNRDFAFMRKAESLRNVDTASINDGKANSLRSVKTMPAIAETANEPRHDTPMSRQLPFRTNDGNAPVTTTIDRGDRKMHQQTKSRDDKTENSSLADEPLKTPTFTQNARRYSPGLTSNPVLPEDVLTTSPRQAAAPKAPIEPTKPIAPPQQIGKYQAYSRSSANDARIKASPLASESSAQEPTIVPPVALSQLIERPGTPTNKIIEAELNLPAGEQQQRKGPQFSLMPPLRPTRSIEKEKISVIKQGSKPANARPESGLPPPVPRKDTVKHAKRPTEKNDAMPSKLSAARNDSTSSTQAETSAQSSTKTIPADSSSQTSQTSSEAATANTDLTRQTSDRSVDTIAIEAIKARVAALTNRPSKRSDVSTTDESTLLSTLEDLSKQSEALHGRYAGLRGERQKLSASITNSLKENKAGPQYTTTLLDQHMALAAITSSMDICFAKLKSLDCRKEEAITALMSQVQSRKSAASLQSRAAAISARAGHSRESSITPLHSREPSKTAQVKANTSALRKDSLPGGTPRIIASKSSSPPRQSPPQPELENDDDLDTSPRARVKGSKAVKVLGMMDSKGVAVEKDITLPNMNRADRLMGSLGSANKAKSQPPRIPLPAAPPAGTRRSLVDSVHASTRSMASSPEDPNMLTPPEDMVKSTVIKTADGRDVRVYAEDDFLDYYRTAP